MKDCALCGKAWAAHEAPLFHCGLPTAHIAMPRAVREAIEADMAVAEKDATIEDLDASGRRRRALGHGHSRVSPARRGE